jgi:hypothetical protein
MADIDRTTTHPDTGVAGTDWGTERDYWRTNYQSRPYVSADRAFEYYEPGYRYGYQEAKRQAGRTWDQVKDDLQREWNEFQYRGQARWEDVKDAVRDAWDRVTGKK